MDCELIVKFDACRESYSGSFCLNWSSGCQSHVIHFLGCQKGSWFQFPRTFPLRSRHRTYAFCSNSGLSTFIMFRISPPSRMSWIEVWIIRSGLIFASYITLQMFFPMGKTSTMIYGCIASIIFCGYIVYDTDNLIKRYGYDEYIWASIALYLDVINLFLNLLTVFRAVDS